MGKAISQDSPEMFWTKLTPTDAIAWYIAVK